MPRVTHTLSLTVGVTNGDQWKSAWDHLNRVAVDFRRVDMPHLNVSSYMLDEEMTDEPPQVISNGIVVTHHTENLYHDEDTLHKVHRALRNAGLDIEQIEICVLEMQNAGILFRERMPD